MSNLSPPSTSPRPWRLWAEPLLLALLALALNLAGNDRTSLWDRDEPRFVGCTLEMKARGDLLYPTFNGEPRYHKPILIYWLQIASTSLLGNTPFAARLVSALAGAATVLLLWRLGRRMFDPRVGRLAALVLASAPIMIAESKLATTDATLMLFLTLAFSALWELEQRESKRWAFTFWIALALAVLTKGPVAPGILAISALVSFLFGGPRLCYLRLRWKPGLILFSALVLPWFAAISILSRGDFLRFILGEQVLGRVTTELETHGGFPGYYLVSTLFSFYPWSCFLPAALLAAWFRRRSGRQLGLLLGWTLGPLLVLECIRTKLLHYYLPSIAACSLLVSWLVFQIADAQVNLRRWPLGRLALGLVAGLGAALAVAFTAAGFVIQGEPRWPLLATGMVLVSGTLVAVSQFHSGKIVRGAHALAATWSLSMLLLGGWLLPAVEPYRLTPIVASRLDRLARSQHARPLLARFRPPGVIFDVGHPISALRDRQNLFRVVQQDQAVVSALDDEELQLAHEAPELSVEVHERLRGFDVESARLTELTLVVIRPSGVAPPVALAPQKTLVK